MTNKSLLIAYKKKVNREIKKKGRLGFRDFEKKKKNLFIVNYIKF